MRAKEEVVWRGRKALVIERPVLAMSLSRPWLYARVVALLAIVALLCVTAFLSFRPNEPDVTTALTTANLPISSPWASAYGHPLGISYVIVALEEAEDVDGHPMNADLLSALLLLANTFGATVVRLLTNGQGQAALRSLGIGRLRWFLSDLEDRSFLSVFRL